MKKQLVIFLFILVYASSIAQSPKYHEKTNKYINDFANVIPDDKEETLTQICKNIEKESSSQVVVITTNILDKEYPIEDYSIQLCKNWGIGQKGLNNGLLILICPNNRKSRIEVGYGLEGTLTDALTSRLQAQYFKPNFKLGDFYTGIFQVLTSIKSTINPEAIEQRKIFDAKKELENQQKTNDFINGLYYFLSFVLLIILIYFFYREIKKQRDRKEKDRLEEEEKKQIAKQEEIRFMSSCENMRNKFISQYKDLYNKINNFGDFLNSKDILVKLKESYETTNLNFESSKYNDYKTISENGKAQLEQLTNDILYKNIIYNNITTFDISLHNTLNTLKSQFTTTSETTKVHYNKFDKSIWEYSFDIQKCNVQNFEIFESSILDFCNKSKEALKLNDFETALQNFNLAKNEIATMNNFIDSLNLVNQNINKDILYINNFNSHFENKISSIDSTIDNSFVSKETKKEWLNAKPNIIINVNIEFTNPQKERQRLESELKNLEKYRSKALKEIEYEKNVIETAKKDTERKKILAEQAKRKKENERSSTYYETPVSDDYNHTNNPSPPDNNISFGGGDFGGGGSTSDW